MKLMLDHNLSPKLARCLAALFDSEHTIIGLRDRFPPNVSDIQWMEDLSREGSWSVLTRDLRLRTRPHERAAMDSSRIVFFFLGGAWKRFTVTETASRLIRLVPKIAAQTDLADQGRFDLPINAGAKLRPHRD